MTQGHPLGKLEKNNSITNTPFTRKENLSLVSFGWARGTKTSPGDTLQQPILLQELGEKKGNCSHMPPKTSMANITTHVILSGDGEKMKISHPTNDPMPFFRKTRKNNSITSPSFR